MGWFCKDFGFGEIDLAYSLSAQTGIPVADIFAKKEDGDGWGKIKHDLPPKEKEEHEEHVEKTEEPEH
jgi:hypothetical protein